MDDIKKTREGSAADSWSLGYESRCRKLHGHNWVITVYCKSEKLNADGMVYDFTHIKELLKEKLDHRNLNEVLPFNPTAENIARWIVDSIEECYRADVQESANNIATYIDE